MSTEEFIKTSGFKRADFDEVIFLSFRFVNDCVNRVTLTRNPWQIMAKQESGEVFYFLPVQNEMDAKAIANRYIVKFATGQHLFGVYTINQALKRIRLYNPHFKAGDLYSFVQNYNKANNTSEAILCYGNRRYISKEVVEDIMDYFDFSNFRDSYE